MENNLEDFLEEDMTKQVDDVLGTNSEDAEAEEEYENEYQDELAEEMNDESYYGRDAGEVLEELEEDLDGEETDEEDEEIEINNSKTIGILGEKFAKKYLEELFKINDVDLKVEKPDKDNDEHDLKILGNGEEYLIEVKLSQNIHPDFAQIHLNNDFKYLLLVWKRNNKFYFSILSKEEIIKNKYATEMHYGRGEDNYVIQTIEIFNKDFLKELAIKLGINKELIDLSNEKKLEIYEEAENEVIEEYYKNIDMTTLTGKMKMLGSVEKGDLMQDELYKYLHYFDADTINNGDGDFDILYKNKRIEVKLATIYNKAFNFYHIKPENFEFLFLIGLEAVDGKDVFYFDIESADEYREMKNRNTEGGKIFSQNGNEICVGRSFFKFGNHLTIEDIDNYIENHS